MSDKLVETKRPTQTSRRRFLQALGAGLGFAAGLGAREARVAGAEPSESLRTIERKPAAYEDAERVLGYLGEFKRAVADPVVGEKDTEYLSSYPDFNSWYNRGLVQDVRGFTMPSTLAIDTRPLSESKVLVSTKRGDLTVLRFRGDWQARSDTNADSPRFWQNQGVSVSGVLPGVDGVPNAWRRTGANLSAEERERMGKDILKVPDGAQVSWEAGTSGGGSHPDSPPRAYEVTVGKFTHEKSAVKFVVDQFGGFILISDNTEAKPPVNAKPRQHSANSGNVN